jgi:Tol biopolymer transport system component
MLFLAPVAIGLALYAFTVQDQVPLDPSSVATATAAAAPSPTASPQLVPTTADARPTEISSINATAFQSELATRFPQMPRDTSIDTPVAPTATPQQRTPVATHGPFHAGAWVRVVAPGDCLNARTQPSLDERYGLVVNMCLPDGYEGMIEGKVAEADGHWWWMIAGAGWVAEDYVVYLHDVAPGEVLAPHLAGLGRIAFVREGAIWTMDADGGDRREIVPALRRNDFPVVPQDLSWSPDGAMLSFNLPVWGADGSDPGSVELHVVRPDGSEVTNVSGVAGRGWSPDGARIGVVRGATPQSMGGGWNGVPGWVDVATRELHLVGDESFYQQDPPQFNFDGTLLLLTRSRIVTSDDGTVNDESVVRIVGVDGTAVGEFASGVSGSFGQPRWSPLDNRISFYYSQPDKAQYAIYDLATRSVTQRVTVPAVDPNSGGRCGGVDMWRSEWSRDGRYLSYAFMFGASGTNGVWSWDMSTGEQRLSSATGATAPSAGPDGWFVFGSSGYLFAGSIAGGWPVLLGDGSFPAWSPARSTVAPATLPPPGAPR